ncbi:Carboxypeptidase regulatory-like domain-containing protein [Catalinimonas alkaloidigena]|uniref:Carboxypeptidase regulatory-like domain-containing protein n=1 Tax=Catalinimonas alkaloidigena TaxID=1075417 RepID=A0A1G9EV49_9BACT|nr:Ig-like domain-containing protein [Catalinimonas alkaloidigena]SDK80004.1 Carboxypeptidase regulatory-like domain-containing protein [Catalinimonas alkaloidigena]
MGKQLSSILLILLLGLHCRCANVRAPEGGTRDTISPVLVKVIPENGSINYKGKQIILEFDENVSIVNPQQNVLITPFREGIKFDYKVKRNRIQLEFEEDFPANTTTTLNFGESIEDITEKNKAKNVRIAFSTGDYLDSLSISGTVLSPLTQLPVEEASVLLYDAQDTLTIQEDKPLYYAVTDEEGEFVISNLAPGEYKIYALVEKNNNLIYDNVDEQIGFLPDSIPLISDTSGIVLYSIASNDDTLRLKRVRNEKVNVTLETNKPFAKVSLFAESTGKELPFTTEANSKIRLYKETDYVDSLRIRVQAEDSIGSILDTIVKVNLSLPVPEEVKVDTVKQAAKASPIVGTDANQWELQLPLPLRQTSSDSLAFFLYQDSTVTSLNVDSILFGRTKLKITLPTTRAYGLLIPAGTLSYINGQTNRKDSLTLKRASSEEVAIARGKVNMPAENIIVELVNDRGEVVRQSLYQSDFTFDNVRPGTYQLRAIVDKNQNGKWDKGSFARKILPEEVHYYTNAQGDRTITLKANWEVRDLTWGW